MWSRFRFVLFLALSCVLATHAQGASYVRESAEEDVFQDLVFDQVIEIYAPTSDSFENLKCRQHSILFRDGVRTRVDWAMNMLDSSSKISPGLLAGNVMDMGHYDQCVGIENIPSSAGPISGRHCMVHFGAQTWKTKIAMFSRMDSHAVEMADTNKFYRNGGHEQPSSDQGHVFSVCIPSSCRPRDLELHLRTTLRGKLTGTDSVRVSDNSCSSREDVHPLTLLDYFSVFVTILIGTLVSLATLRDFQSSPEVSASRRDVLQVFSLRVGARQLLRPTPPGNDSLPVLDGIRVISMLGVMVLHHLAFLDHTPAINLAESDQNLSHWLRLTTISTLHVDSFFLLSGVLVCYSFLNNRERNPFSILRFYRHRLVRLAPLLAFTIILMTSNIGAMLHEGPLVKTSFLEFQQTCANNWFYSLTFLGNFLSPKDICVPYSWSLAMDMQLYWLSPLVLIPLFRWPKFGKVLTGALFLTGLFVSFWVSYINEIQFIPTLALGVTNVKVYYPTYMRFTPWLIGVGLGYVLHATKRSSLGLSRAAVTAGWTLSVGLMTAAMLSSYRYHHPGFQNSVLSTALFVSLQRPAWALGLAWVILACSRGHGGGVNSILSGNQYQVPSRLSYSVFMFHPVVIGNFFITTKTPYYMSTSFKMSQLLLGLAVTGVVAALVHLAVELPMINLEKSFQGGLDISKERRNKTLSTSNSSKNRENGIKSSTTRILVSTAKREKKLH